MQMCEKKMSFSNGFVRKETIFFHFSLSKLKVDIPLYLQLYYFCERKMILLL